MAKKKTTKKQDYEVIDKADVRPGMLVRVHLLIKDVTAKGEEKERVQIFEGLVLSRKHGNTPGATFTVRKVSEGIGVEKTFPIHSPLVTQVDVVDRKQTNRAKLYYTRDYKKRLKSESEIVRTYEKGVKPSEPKKKEKPAKKEATPAEKKTEAKA